MKSKFLKVMLILVIFLILIVLVFSPLIFQEGNPIPYFTKIVSLNDDKFVAKVSENDVETVYITKQGYHEDVIKLIEDKYDVELYNQMGSAYIFRENGVEKIGASVRIYLSRFNVWRVYKVD